jgi:hypothetical protein
MLLPGQEFKVASEKSVLRHPTNHCGQQNDMAASLVGTKRRGFGDEENHPHHLAGMAASPLGAGAGAGAEMAGAGSWGGAGSVSPKRHRASAGRAFFHAGQQHGQPLQEMTPQQLYAANAGAAEGEPQPTFCPLPRGVLSSEALFRLLHAANSLSRTVPLEQPVPPANGLANVAR